MLPPIPYVNINNDVKKKKTFIVILLFDELHSVVWDRAEITLLVISRMAMISEVKFS